MTGVGTALADHAPSLCRVRYPSDTGVEWRCRRLGPGETLERLFGDRWTDVARFNRVDRRHAGPGTDLKVPVRLGAIRGFTPMPASWAAAEAEPRMILVDLSEQFLGAYERGRLVFSAPVTVGERGASTPTGEFRITAAERRHASSLYTIEGTDIPYPMTWALRFLVTRGGTSYWLHGRDMPGFPASHGCVGLYDEWMQREYYGYPRRPVLDDARLLYEWVLGPAAGMNAGLRTVKDGPRVRIVGAAPAVD